MNRCGMHTWLAVGNGCDGDAVGYGRVWQVEGEGVDDLGGRGGSQGAEMLLRREAVVARRPHGHGRRNKHSSDLVKNNNVIYT